MKPVVTFISLLLLTVSILSCKKGEDAAPKSDYYGEVSIDGQTRYKDLGGTDNVKILTYINDLYGLKYERFSFGFYLNQYGGPRFVFGAHLNKLGKPDTLQIDQVYYQSEQNERYRSLGTQQTNGICIITKVDSSVIEGTFAFDVYSNEGKGTEKVRFTNGKFKVKY